MPSAMAGVHRQHDPLAGAADTPAIPAKQDQGLQS
jgi:hypothetical protein